jgi:hypothetical protein
MKGLFRRYLYVKYQNPIPHGLKDTAQVKVFSLISESYPPWFKRYSPG